jgi:hypothetical protein
MDDLDRLYHELVDSMRRQRPAALLKPFTVHEVYERLVPYRRLRNALGFRSNEDYEAALSRLLAGERGYLSCDGDMQSELRAGLGELLPDIRRYQAFPETRVWLNPEEIPPPGDIRYAPPEIRERAVADLDVVASGASDERPTSEVSVESDAAVHENSSPVDAADDAVNRTEGDSGPVALGRCPQCAGEPPDAAFCPFCGARLAAEKCAACGAEMEPTWLFCAACGKPKG